MARANDTFYPVCSPEFACRLNLPLRSEDLLSLPLIASDTPDPSWLSWPDWFERAGFGRRSPGIALQFNHYTDGIAAAIAGQGVTLGWNLILTDLLAKGQLVPLLYRLRDGDIVWSRQV
ncbi:MAG: hypothetical protein JO223_10535 [Hyphomicrobiales bacterium]|nr:hypothetical protein [Hyphomicrobiales bacterium]MBV8443078.1 hypothetical protein [Hyphomicrobiales bacterium]